MTILVRLPDGWTISERERVIGRADPTSCMTWRLEHEEQGKLLIIEEAHGIFTLTQGKLRLHNASWAAISKAVKRACGRSLRELIDLLQEKGDAEAEDFARFGGEA